MFLLLYVQSRNKGGWLGQNFSAPFSAGHKCKNLVSFWNTLPPNGQRPNVRFLVVHLQVDQLDSTQHCLEIPCNIAWHGNSHDIYPVFPMTWDGTQP
jgi:hypothetical protein